MTGASEPADVARAFVDRINDHDVDGLAALMTEDHVFVDAMGVEFIGRENMRENWKSYLEAFPDYEVVIEELLPRGETVAIFGIAKGTFAGDAKGRWKTPGAWKAVIRDGLVAQWQVFCDTEDEGGTHREAAGGG
ncbi:MAG: nuclear transport factor 2 family protein [Planctomycetota bacterium]